MVEHERVRRRRVVAPQPDLGRELHVAPGVPRLRDAEPRRQVGDAGAGKHRVCTKRTHAVGKVPGAEDGGPLPSIGRCIQVGRVRGLVRVPRVGIGLRPQRRDPVAIQASDVLALVVDLEDPVPDPVVEVLPARRGACLDPELVVLAVPVDREIAREQATRMRAHLRLADREHPVRGDPHEMRPSTQIVDHALDGHDGPPACGQRAPHTFEHRRVDGDVAVTVGDGCVQQRDVRNERREETDLAERRGSSGVGVVFLHRRPGDRPGHDGGKVARRRLEPLRKREEGPVLDRNLPALVCAGEDRVGREVREGVARVAGDDPLDEPAPEEQRPQAGETQHHQREARFPPPPLPHHLAGGGGPAGVADEDVQRVAGPHVCGDRILERRDLVVARGRHALSSTRSARRRRCQPW